MDANSVKEQDHFSLMISLELHFGRSFVFYCTNAVGVIAKDIAHDTTAVLNKI